MIKRSENILPFADSGIVNGAIVDVISVYGLVSDAKGNQRSVPTKA